MNTFYIEHEEMYFRHTNRLVVQANKVTGVASHSSMHSLDMSERFDRHMPQARRRMLERPEREVTVDSNIITGVWCCRITA